MKHLQNKDLYLNPIRFNSIVSSFDFKFFRKSFFLYFYFCSLSALTTENVYAAYVEPLFQIQFYPVSNSISCNMVQVKVRIRFYGDNSGTTGETVYVAGMHIPIYGYPNPSTVITFDDVATEFSVHSIFKGQSWFDYDGSVSTHGFELTGTNPNGSCCSGDMEFTEGVLYDLCTIYMYVEDNGLVQFEDMVTPTVTFDYQTSLNVWTRDEFEINQTIGDYPLEVEEHSGSYDISGTIYRQPDDPNTFCPDGMPIVGMQYILTGPDPDIQYNSTTDFEGHWCFPGASGDLHDVIPYTMGIGNKLCGITTADIVAIQRHILGLETFTPRWKKLAADVNNNQIITAADVSCLRRAILGVTFTEGPCSNFNDSWRFETEHSYNNSSDLSFAPAYYDLTGPVSGKNFYGFKVGDVNNTCNNCQTIKNNDKFETRSSTDTLTLALGNPVNTLLGYYKIPVYSKISTTLSLLSISLSDPLSSITGVGSWLLQFDGNTGDYDIKNAGANIDLIWNMDTLEYITIPEDTLLFYILSEDSTNNFSLSTSNVNMRNEWYPETDDFGPVKLIKEVGSFGLKKKINFVYPNPGKEEIVISLKEMGNLPTNIEIRSLSGLILEQRSNITSDFIKIPVREFLKGIYLISMQNAKKRHTQKWMKIE